MCAPPFLSVTDTVSYKQSIMQSGENRALLVSAVVYSNAVEMRDKFKDAFLKKHGVKLGFMSPLIKASAFALQDQPTVNAVIEGTEIIYRDYIDISVAVATPKVA